MANLPVSYKDSAYDSLDQKVENKLGITPGLLSAIRLHGEMSNADQVSSAGAKSVYQITPTTRNLVLKKYGVDAYLNPENAALTAGYLLKEGLQRNDNNPVLAAREYHGGTNRNNWGAVNEGYGKRIAKALNAFNPISTATASDEFITQEQKDEYDSWKAKQAQISQDLASIPPTDIPDQTPMDQPQQDQVSQDQVSQDQPTQAPDQGIIIQPKENLPVQPQAKDDGTISQEEFDAYNAWKAAATNQQASTNPVAPNPVIPAIQQPVNQPPANEPKSLPFVDSLVSGAGNLPGGLYDMGASFVNAAKHPIDTATGLGDIARGAMQKAIPDKFVNFLIAHGITPKDDRPKAEAFAKDYVNAYGGWDNIKNTLANDPVRLLSDISMFAGGAGMASKAVGASKITSALEALSSATDPIKGISRIASKAGSSAIDLIGNAGTHTGGQSIIEAAKAGMAGGSKADAFLGAANRGDDIASVIAPLKSALSNMRAARGENYRAAMNTINTDPTILDINKVQDVVKNATLGKFKDYVYNKKAAGVQGEILKEVEDFKNLDPSLYHTVEGFDKLKQSIGDIRDSTEFGSPGRVVADKAYHAVKNEIVKQAPQYGAAMKDYETLSTKLKEIEKTFSLGDKASADSAIRKMQSVLRNNANTNYGNRGSLLKELESYGAENVSPALAGQSMNTWTPRGLGSPVIAGNIGYGLANPLALTAVPFQSPKLVGNVAYGAGSLARPIAKGLDKFPLNAELKNFISGLSKSEFAKMFPNIAARYQRDNENKK